MYFVGVDLAWGGRKPTGLAVLDDGGRLVHLSSAVGDRAIIQALRPYVDGDVLVAVDAPLVVANATGNRPAEAALGRDFARFDAGAHPVNTGRPGFEESPRGARLAASLGLEIGGVSSRRAVEVYPHPATIALFRLPRVLRYKQKPGRSLEQLRSELLRLVDLVQGLSSATPALHVAGCDEWATVAAAVAGAARKSELRPAEDEVDAVICAYVALVATRAPQRVTTYGDPTTGEIVTPTLPLGHRPGPRRPDAPAPDAPAPDAPAPDAPPEGPAEAPAVPVTVSVNPVRTSVDPVRAAVDAYAAGHPALVHATEAFVDVVTSQLDDAGINYLTVSGRAKGIASFAGKAARTLGDELLYPDPLVDITDQIGVRVITYLHEDVSAVADLLSDEYVVLDDRDMGQETANEGRFGYASRHLLLATHSVDSSVDGSLDSSVDSSVDGSVDSSVDGSVDSVSGPAATALAGRSAQVQIRTVLQHAWAEFEHDIRYKGTIPKEHASDLDRRFTLAAGLLELADREFSTIRERLQATMSDLPPEPPEEDDDPRISPPDLATYLGARFADAGWSRTDHYEWMSGLLLELGITSLEELAGMLTSVDAEGIDARMGYRYPAGAVRRLDDALLAVYGARYVGLHGNAHREPLLLTRLEKLRGPGA